MAKVREQSEVLKAYLKRLGNPYASLQVSDNAEQKDASVVSNVTQRPYVRHPYAYASMEVGSNISSSAIAKPPAKGALAKAEFRAKCRRIFEQYIPTIEKGRLRTHHRDLSPVMSPVLRQLGICLSINSRNTIFQRFRGSRPTLIVNENY